MMTMIRPYTTGDAAVLRRLAQTFSPAAPLPATSRRTTWVLLRQGEIIGCAGFALVPGLPGVADLDGFIAPRWQRGGAGSQLLRFVLRRAWNAGISHLNHAVPSLDTPAAHFLTHHHFHLEHSETQFRLSPLDALPPPTLPPGYTVATLSERSVIPHFRALYDASFAPHPWHQPYPEDADVRAEMDHVGATAADFLFLQYEAQPVGVAWLRRLPFDEGEIEPVGIMPAHQRRGLGRALLLLALNRLYAQGIRATRIAAWDANAAATHLYRSLGFRPASRLFYLTRATAPT